MSKFLFLFLLFFLFSIQLFAQIIEYPWRPLSIPSAKLKGAVHTVLTIEQRGERVFGTIVEVYDLKGKLTETMGSNASIEIHSGQLLRGGGKRFFSYDASGKLIKEKYFEPEGNFWSYTSYIYDSKNRLIAEIEYDTKDKIRSKTSYAHFPEKRVVEITGQVVDEGSLNVGVKTLVSYNDKGQFIKRTELNSKVNDSVSFEYDGKGNFVKEVHCCNYNYSYDYSYKFDKQGNWIEREQTYTQVNKITGEQETENQTNYYRVITYYSDYETKP